MAEKRKNPVYHGMTKYVDEAAGYGIWLPSNWRRVDMMEGRQGVIFMPDPADANTCLIAEKHLLKYRVRREDAPALREGIEEGLKTLSGVEIEKNEEALTATLLIFDTVFTFLEEAERRKRWVRNVYWEEGQLVLIAQGSTPEEYEYWLPMFYNIMMTAEAGSQ